MTTDPTEKGKPLQMPLIHHPVTWKALVTLLFVLH